MRTPDPHPRAKEKLLDAAERLMLVKGFAATTVEEICEAAGLTKGSLFHYFKTKEELAKAVLDRFCQCRLEIVQQSPFLKKKDPLERVYGWVDFTIEMSRSPMTQKGCLLGNFAQELSDTHPQIRSCCADHFAQWAGVLKRELDAAKTKYASKAPLDTRSLAEHFIAVLEGSLILAKAKQDVGVFGKNMRHFKRYLQSLFER